MSFTYVSATIAMLLDPTPYVMTDMQEQPNGLQNVSHDKSEQVTVESLCRVSTPPTYTLTPNTGNVDFSLFKFHVPNPKVVHEKITTKPERIYNVTRKTGGEASDCFTVCMYCVYNKASCGSAASRCRHMCMKVKYGVDDPSRHLHVDEDILKFLRKSKRTTPVNHEVQYLVDELVKTDGTGITIEFFNQQMKLKMEFAPNTICSGIDKRNHKKHKGE